MKNIQYEWIVEEIDVGFLFGFETCPSLKDYPETEFEIALVLMDWNSTTEGKYWAYVKDGIMSTVFLDAFGIEHDYKKVPEKFIKEFNKKNNLGNR
jgi:hypothetical protein